MARPGSDPSRHGPAGGEVGQDDRDVTYRCDDRVMAVTFALAVAAGGVDCALADVSH